MFTENKHDGEVEDIAWDYKSKGFDVKADHTSDFPDPDTYRGKRPDVVASKNGRKTLVEVETKDSVSGKRAEDQNRQFSIWESSKPSERSFWRKVV